jgi:hypothetical protein
MNKNTLLILGAVAAAAGVGFYFYKKSKASPLAAGSSGGNSGATLPKSGGGTGANKSSSPAYNGDLTSALGTGVDYLKGIGASVGHLFNGTGGATSHTTSSDPAPTDAGTNDYNETVSDGQPSTSDVTDYSSTDGFDYSQFE